MVEPYDIIKRLKPMGLHKKGKNHRNDYELAMIPGWLNE